MGKITDRLYKEIEENENGIVQYDIGLKKASYYIDNLRKGNFILLGGGSGSGKTTFALYHYVYKPIMFCIEHNIKDLDIIMCCLEMAATNVLSKLETMYIYDKYGIDIGYRDMMSFKGKLKPEHKEIIMEVRPMMAKIESYIRFIETGINHATLQNYLTNYFERRGTFMVDGSYMPKNPKLLTFFVLDHIGEVSVPPGMTKKESIDRVADVLKISRNKFGMTSLVLQQINRVQSSVERRTKFPGIESNDFKDSGNVYEKSDTAIALYNPFKDKQKSVFDYDVLKMGNRLRVLQILKGRYGEADVNIGLAFYGEASMFKEIPPGASIDDYSRYMSPSYLKEGDMSLDFVNNNSIDI